MADLPISEGDYVVTASQYSIESREVKRVTERTIYVASSWGGSKLRRVARDQVVYAGPQKHAEWLCGQLQSSRDQYDTEQVAAADRMRERDMLLVRKAYIRVR